MNNSKYDSPAPRLDKRSKRLLVLTDKLSKRVDIVEAAAGVPPDPPDSISASDNADGTITLDIDDASPDAAITGYRIYRKLSAGVEYALITDIDTTVITNDYIDNDASLATGSTYDYVASAVNRSAGSESTLTASSSATITDTSAPVFSSGPPAAIDAQGAVGKCIITWPAVTTATTDLDYYKVECNYSKDGDTLATREVGYFDGNSAHDYDLTATGGAAGEFSNFTYTVTAYDVDDNTVAIGPTAVDVANYQPADGTVPAVPGTLTATSDEDGRVVLSWVASAATDLKEYQIDRTYSRDGNAGPSPQAAVSIGDTYETIAVVDSSIDRIYTDQGLYPNIIDNWQYQYRIWAIDTMGNRSTTAASSSTVSAVDTTAPSPPQPTATQKNGYLSVSWSDSATRAVRHHLFRGTSANPTTLAVILGGAEGADAGTIVYEDLEANDSTATYYYRIKSEDRWGNLSAYGSDSTGVSPVNYVDSNDLSTKTVDDGVVVDSTGIKAYDSTVETFSMLASNGTTTIGRVAASQGNFLFDTGGGDNDGDFFARINTTVWVQLDASASELLIGTQAAEHIIIGAGSLKIQEGNSPGTVYTSLTGGTLTLGDTSNEHVAISATGIDLNDGLTTYLSLNVSAVTLTVGATADYHTVFGASTIEMKDDSANSVVKIGTAVSDPYIRIQETTSTAYWELRKPDNNNDFYVLPETDSIFAIRNSGNGVNSWAVDQTATSGSIVNNITKHMLGKTVGNPVLYGMGGVATGIADAAVVELFRFSLPTDGFLAGKVRIVSWSPDATQNSGSVTYWRLFIHKDTSGSVYPTTLNFEQDTGTGLEDDRTIAGGSIVGAIANVSGSIYKVTIDIDFNGSLGVSDIAYYLDAMGIVDDLENSVT